jgi:RNA polymerase sigma-70 factor (ECF subfamily)
VVARVAYRHLRRRKLERRLFAVDLPEVPEKADRRPAASITHRGTLRRIQRHFDAMDVNKLWTFLLHDVHGYDLDEVAEITGVSRAAAQSRLVRGRRELHERVARDGELRSILDELDERDP